MPKKHFLQQNDLSKLKRERDVMILSGGGRTGEGDGNAGNPVTSVATSSWLIELKYSFQSEHFIYLAMEFVPGIECKPLYFLNVL